MTNMTNPNTAKSKPATSNNDTAGQMTGAQTTGSQNTGAHAENGSATEVLPAMKQFVHDNPTLVLAGVVAAGAIAAVALRSRRQAPSSLSRRLRRDLADYTSDVQRTVREEIRASGLEARMSAFGNSVASIDWKPYLKPIVDQAFAIAEDAKARIAKA